jgi:hypothetical protein
VVDVEHDAGLVGGATAIPAAEGVSLKDGEPKPGRNRTTGGGRAALHRRSGFVRGDIAESPAATLALQARSTVTRVAVLHHRSGDARMALVGGHFPGRPGSLGIVNIGNPGLMPLGRNADQL